MKHLKRNNMPKIKTKSGKVKHFPYTKEGVKKAKKFKVLYKK